MTKTMKMPVIALMVAALFAASSFQPKEAKAIAEPVVSTIVIFGSIGISVGLIVILAAADGSKANIDNPEVILDQLRTDASMFLANGTETPLLEEAFVQIDEQADKAGIAVDDVQKAKAIIDVK
jgi:hypothetical protein